MLFPLLVLSASAQAEPDEDDLADLARRLAEALERIDQLEDRLAAYEADGRHRTEEEDLEARLQALIAPVGAAAAPRTTFPSAYNPRIAVFMDATIEAGDTQEDLDDDEADRFSLRETEIDLSLPISPFAEGVLVAVYEDAGNGEFEAVVEEGYADIAVGPLLDTDVTTRARLGRVRLPFGHDNKLHTHDLIQVDRPYAASQQLGGEGLIGDGLEIIQPLFQSAGELGTGSATTLSVAVVNGELFAGEESLLGELASDAGLELDSDAPVVATRLSHFIELGRLSDLELGASWLGELATAAIKTDMGTYIEPDIQGLDVTWRQRDDETGVGSWLVLGEFIRTHLDYGAATVPDFPVGDEKTSGWWLTAQRQTSPTTYVGVRYGKTDVLGTSDVVRDLSPYVSWYADEFFRIRLEGQHLHFEGDRDEDVQRMFLNFTWNFGSHRPHPYWVNR